MAAWLRRMRGGAHTKHIALLGLVALLFCVGITSATTQAAPRTSDAIAVYRSARIIAQPVASTGCGRALPAPPGTSSSEALISGGRLRRYRLHIPRGYRNTVALPLVLNFHGHGSNAAQQEQRTAFDFLADRERFIVAYPQGVVGPDGLTGWATGAPGKPRINDLLFVSDLLNHLQASLCIDPTRIYATGFSNGGGMTNLLACKLAGRIAAFAPISGAYPPVPGGCHPPRPVPMLEIHGTADHIVPYTGNALRDDPPIAHWLQDWAARNGCHAGPQIFMHHGAITGERWNGCRAGSVLIHYRIAGEGHLWPAAFPFGLSPGRHPQPIKVDALIWAFFEAHPLPRQMSTR